MSELSQHALRAAEEIAAWLEERAEDAATDEPTWLPLGLREGAEQLRLAAEDAVLTIPHIADELNVGRAYVVQLLNDGALPLATPTRLQRLGLAGKRTRRVRLADVRAYAAKLHERRRQALVELMRLEAEDEQDTRRRWRAGETIPPEVMCVQHEGEPQDDPDQRGREWVRKAPGATTWKGPWAYALEEQILLREHGPVVEYTESEEDA